MAGLGFKDFAVGEVLTAADVDGYLMQQSVMRFADSAARGSALGTAVGTGVPLAEGMVAYLDDVNRVELYDGTVWRPSGAVVQVVQTVKTDAFSTTSSTFTDVTGLSATITPTSASSQVLVLVDSNISQSSSDTGAQLRLMRGATVIRAGDAASSRTVAALPRANNVSDSTKPYTLVFLDSPATTSSVTYSIQVRCDIGANTVAVNRNADDTNASTTARGASTFTLFEVAA